MKEAFGSMRSDLMQKSHRQADECRSVYEEKLKTLSGMREQITDEISGLKQQKTRIEYSVHFEDEIKDCEERLRRLSAEEKDTTVKMERMKLDCERLRQQAGQNKRGAASSETIG